REGFPPSEQRWQALGRRGYRKARVARGQGACGKDWRKQTRTARPAQLCRIPDYAESVGQGGGERAGDCNRFGIFWAGLGDGHAGEMQTFIDPGLLDRLRVGPLA